LLTDQVPGTAIPVLTAWLTAASIVIIICGIVELFKNDILSATVNMATGALVVLGVGLGFNASRLLPNEVWEEGLALCGWVIFGIGFLMLVLVPATLKVSVGTFISQIIWTVATVLLGIGLMQRIGFGDSIVNIAGWLILVGAAYSIYSGGAMITNTVYGTRKLPF